VRKKRERSALSSRAFRRNAKKASRRVQRDISSLRNFIPVFAEFTRSLLAANSSRRGRREDAPRDSRTTKFYTGANRRTQLTSGFPDAAKIAASRSRRKAFSSRVSVPALRAAASNPPLERARLRNAKRSGESANLAWAERGAVGGVRAGGPSRWLKGVSVISR